MVPARQEDNQYKQHEQHGPDVDQAPTAQPEAHGTLCSTIIKEVLVEVKQAHDA